MCKQKFSKQQTNNPQLRVYVANIGKYNSGELIGGWIDLPATNNQIKTFLKHQVRLNSPCEDEYAIHDFESDFNLGEYENLYDLNLLAIKLEQMSVTEKNIAAAYCSVNGLKDTTSILNIAEQVNEISYVELDANDWGSREEKLGYAMLDGVNSDLKATLEQCKLSEGVSAYSYFDFEAYGRDISINEGYFAADNIFIFYHSDIDPKLYTLQELKEPLLHDPRLEAF
jgi:antirestriction protein